MKFLRAIVFVAGIAGFWVSFTVHAQNPSQVASDAPARYAVLPVALDGRILGNVNVRVGRGGTLLEVEFASLRPLLEAVPLPPERIDLLSTLVDARGDVSVNRLRQAGIAFDIDPANAVLLLALPVAERAVQDIDLRPRNAPPGMIVGPGDFSAYANLRAGLDYIHHAQPFLEGRQPITLGLDAASNWKGWVLEGRASYVQRGDPSFVRGDVRLVRDDVENAVRYSAGDLNYNAMGFQTFLPMGGVNIAREYSLQPGSRLANAGRQDIILDLESDVNIFVNGVRERTLRLPPGRYSLRDFPVAPGINDVEIRILDSAGRETTVLLPFFFSPMVLAEGQHDFNFALGAASTDLQGRRQYNEAALSVYQRYGFTNDLTMGYNVQGTRDWQLAGIETSANILFGAARLDIAASRNQANPGLSIEEGKGFAARLGYEYFDAGGIDALGRSLNASAQYFSPSFADDPFSDASGNVAAEASIRATQEVAQGLSLGAGATYRWRRDSKDEDFQSLFTSWSVGYGLFANATLERRSRALVTDEQEYRALVSLSFRFGQNHFARMSYDSRQAAKTASYSYFPTSRNYEPSLFIQARDDENGQAYNGAVSVNGPRFESQFLHDSRVIDGSGIEFSRSGARLGAALAFVDGAFALSRPIHGGFVMVKPHPAIKNNTIYIDGTENDPAARADALGPAVIPVGAPYFPRTLRYNVPDLPLHHDVGAGFTQVQTSYRGGALVIVGTAAKFTLGGQLMGGNGQPVPLVAGEALHLPTGSVRSFFTNRKGFFRIHGLEAGLYRLTFVGLKGTYEVDLSNTDEGTIDIGPIRLRGE